LLLFSKYFGIREDETIGKVDLTGVTFIPTMEQIKTIT
jgi:hypothetical protein